MCLYCHITAGEPRCAPLLQAIAAFTCTAKAVACAASEMRRALRALPRETDWPGEGTNTGSRVVDHAATNAGLGGSVRRGEEAAVAAAHSLQATLVRIEEGVLGTSTGSARSMAAYYEHWERRLQDALADCAISWIEGLTSRLSGSCDDTGRTIHVQVWDDEDVGCERCADTQRQGLG